MEEEPEHMSREQGKGLGRWDQWTGGSGQPELGLTSGDPVTPA